MKTAVFSVVYPGVEEYLDDFFLSLSSQDDKDFELFIVNDGLNNLKQWTSKLKMPFYIREVEREMSPAAIRKFGIKWLETEKIKCVIFADSDDYFANNRVYLTKIMLSENQFIRAVVNQLILFGDHISQPKSMFGEKLKEGSVISEQMIRYGNCCGLSNTAAYLNDLIKVIDQISDQTIAFDWQLFTRLLLNGAKVIYTNRTATYYRQHGNNIASPYLRMESSIICGVRIKIAHYSSLSQLNSWYSEKAIEYQKLLQILQNNQQFKNSYIKSITEHVPENTFWWEMIKSLEEIRYDDEA